MAKKKRIGILTGGGDAPGLNAVIRAVVFRANQLGRECVGLLDGWRGALSGDHVVLTIEETADIHRQGGTVLGSSRTNVRKEKDGFKRVKDTLKRLNIDALVAIGGEDTLGVARDLYKEGGKVVGVPKTIDNDVNATDYSFGFDTATNIVMECLDKIHTTAQSHHRVMVVEIMGRHAGWITLYGGMAGGAHVILIPEQPIDTDKVCDVIRKRYKSGKTYSLVAVAEGAIGPDLEAKIMHSQKRDSFGHVLLGSGIGIGTVLATEIEERTGFESRHIVLGHLQRGGPPSAFDRVLGTRLGVKVVDMIADEKFGHMASLQGSQIVAVPLDDAVGETKNVPDFRYEEATLFFG